MLFGSLRGTIRIVRHTYRACGMEQLMKMLPDGLGIIPLFAEIERGTQNEFKIAFRHYGRMVMQLTEIGIDVIRTSGALPLIVPRYEGRAALVKDWCKKYGKPIFTSDTEHIDALRALCAQRFVGFSYFPSEINKIYAHYFEDAGFNAFEKDYRVPVIHAVPFQCWNIQ
jgi:maleate cis-trans isomerase